MHVTHFGYPSTSYVHFIHLNIQAGDAIFMAPYVVQWYAALGTTPSR